MTHFNHEWDTTKTPAVPVSVGDRYYAQDLNDDFNYLKHLPYEVFLQGRSRGVMITPNDTWDNNANSLTLSGGFGVILRDCIELDTNEDFAIPPKTHSSPRYERIPFTDVVLILPNDSAMHYIVTTPTKRSLLQRAKALFTDQYASRIRYDGIITIQDTAPTTDQILIGLCHDKEYCLLIDNNPDQCKGNIILKKWFGQNKITQSFLLALRSYYNVNIYSIKTNIYVDTVSNVRGIYDDDDIYIFNHCIININNIGIGGTGIGGGIFNHCIININNIGIGDIGIGIGGGTFNYCTVNINIDPVNGTGVGASGGTFNYCNIYTNKLNRGWGVTNGTFNHCIIYIDTVFAHAIGIDGGFFNHCDIDIDTVNETGTGVANIADNHLYLTRIVCSVLTNLNNTSGKLNILNGTVLHTS